MATNVEVRLSANTTQYQKAMRDAGTSTEGVAKATTATTSTVGSKWQTAGSKITSSMIPSYAAVGVAAGVAAKYAIDAASNLAESTNAVKVSYGEVSDAVLDLGRNATEQFGLSQRAFNDAAVSFTNFAEDVAGDGGDVAGTLETLMLRSTDFASVMNMDVTEAANAFKSALSGEAEPLKAFGINISDAAVKAYALESGLIAVGETMSDQEKVQARFGLLMKETDKVAGDFANTSDGYAGAIKKARAEVENLAASLGNVLIPALAAALGFITDTITGWQEIANLPAVSWTVNTVSDIPSTLDDFENAIWGWAGRVTGIGPQVTSTIDDASESLNTHTGAVHLANEETAEWVAKQLAAEAAARAAIQTTEDLASSTYLVTQSINDAINAHNREAEALNAASDARRALTDDTYAAADAEDAWWEQIQETTDILADAEAGERDKAKSTRDLAMATNDVVTAQLTANGVNVDSVAGQSAWLSAMMETTRGLSGPMRTEVLNYMSLVSGIPVEHLTEVAVNLDTDGMLSAKDALVDMANSVGGDVAAGIAAGVSGNAYLVSIAAGNTVRQALNAAKTIGRIASPSRLFAEGVGQPISAGIAEGIAEDAYKISSSLGKAIESAEKEAIKAAESLVDAAGDALTGFWGGIDSQRSEEDLREGVADAEDNLNKVLGNGESTAEQVADARNRLEDANYRLAKATVDMIYQDGQARDSWVETAKAAGLTALEIDGLIAKYDELALAKAAAALAKDEIAAEADSSRATRIRFGEVAGQGLVSADELKHLQANQDPAYQLWYMGEIIKNLDAFFGTATARAGGGPVRAGHLYEVGEGNVAEMFMSGGRQYMIPGNNGQVLAGGAAGSGSRGGISIGQVVTADNRGMRRELETMMWATSSR